jgi:hypothetical protein
MARMLKIAGVLAIAGLVLGPGLFGAKPKPPVKVRVSFEGLTDPGYPPNDPNHYAQKLHNDAWGPYEATNGLTAQITGDLGDFVFEIPHHAGRSVLVVFPYVTSQLGDYLPDTAGVYPTDDDPIDYFVMRTYNSFATKKLDFLAMTPGASAEVHFWAWMCTEAVHSYRVIYNQPDPDHDAGIVEVKAFDLSPLGGDGVADHWEITPVLGTSDQAWITRWDRKKGWLYYGYHPMPFKLIIDRI